MCREFTQKQVVSRGVADQPTDKKASEALFFQLYLNSFYSSLEMTVWLQLLAHRSLVRRRRSGWSANRLALKPGGDASLN